MRSSLVMLRSTRPPRHSRVCSSTMDTILTGRPSVVASNWKATAHTAFGASATGTVRSRRRGACAGGVEAPAGTHRAKAAESSSGGRLSLLSSRPAPRAAAAGGRPRAGSHTTVTGAPASPARQVSQSRHERALIPWSWLLQAGRARRRREATCDLDHHSPADPRRVRRGWSQDRGPYVARQAGGAIARPAMEGHGWRIAFQALDR